MDFKRIYLEITNICNLNCSFCSKSERSLRSMSLNEIELILEKIKKTNAHIYPHIKGEPLMHPDFEEFVKLTAKYGIPLNVTTNGVLISRYEDLLLKYARQINISVHSLSDGQIKDEEKYLKDITAIGLKASSLKAPSISYRLWTENENEAFSDESYKIISRFAKAFNTDIPREIKKGRSAIKLADNVYISLMNKFVWPKEDKEIRTAGNCLGGKEMLGILSDGTVVPCCLDSEGVISLGNIFTQSLEEILKGNRYLALKKGFSGGIISEGLCRSCTFYTSRKSSH